MQYAALYGDELAALVVNASRPGWLAEVRRLMSDDAYYERRIRAWVRAARARLADRSLRPRAEPPNYHCQWLLAVEEAARHGGAGRAEARWPPCACPAGNRADLPHRENRTAEALLRDRWLPACETPSA